MSAFRLICPYGRLPVERGVAALVDGEQVAVFRTADGDLYAVSNSDPFSGAMVLSRGIVGSRGDRPTVASPVYKQVFDLETGQCLDDPAVLERRAAREAISAARETRLAARKTERAAEDARLAAESQARAAAAADSEAREQADKLENDARLEAERKAARDARYAARKARK